MWQFFHSEVQLYSEYDKDTAATFQERRRHQRLPCVIHSVTDKGGEGSSSRRDFGKGRAQDLPRLGCEGAMHVAAASNFGGVNIVRACMQFELRCWSEVVSRHTGATALPALVSRLTRYKIDGCPSRSFPLSVL
jgi:hypothetical protein